MILFDHLVGAGKQGLGHRQAERPCCLQVNGEFVLVRGLHRQIRRFFAFEDAIDVGSRTSVLVSKIRPIGHQSAGSDKRTLNVNRGQLVAGGRCDNQIAVDGAIAFAVTIIPPFDDCAKSAIAGSISADSRRLIGLTSMPIDGATDWMTANWPIPAATAGSRRTAACVTLGAISVSSSNHFPHKLYSNIIKPVALAPGFDRLSTKPDPRGSGTMTNTMGVVSVSFSITSTA